MVQSLRVAVADDEPDMREYFRKLLPRLGIQVVAVAANGRELVEQCLTANPDLVISDLRMPGMDGMEAATALNRVRPIPFILVSAHCHPELMAAVQADHVLTHVVKPINQAVLASAVALTMYRFEQFKARNPEATDEPPATASVPYPHTALCGYA